MVFEGLIKNVERRYRETGSETMKAEYETFMRITPCSECKGQRLKKGSLAVTVGEKNIAELTAFSIDKLQKFLQGLELTETQLLIGEQILKEIKARIQFLLVPDLLVWPIFWMNRVSDCISGTTTSYLPH